MKAYGLIRTLDIEYPDCVDIKTYALKSSIGHLKRKSGDYRGSHKNKNSKRSTRRYFKRIERQKAKNFTLNYEEKY